jgi:hypothetical protein
MLKTFLFVLLFTGLVVTVSEAQDYETGTVLKSEMRPYSQSADIAGDQVVYFIQAGNAVYQIANHSTKTEMSAGQKIKYRVGKNHFYVFNEKGKETKYEIVGKNKWLTGTEEEFHEPEIRDWDNWQAVLLPAFKQAVMPGQLP